MDVFFFVENVCTNPKIEAKDQMKIIAVHTETAIKVFSQNNHYYIWRRTKETCKATFTLKSLTKIKEVNHGEQHRREPDYTRTVPVTWQRISSFSRIIRS